MAAKSSDFSYDKVVPILRLLKYLMLTICVINADIRANVFDQQLTVNQVAGLRDLALTGLYDFWLM